MIKEETVITLANEGMHNQKAYVKMKAMLTNNTYQSPRLYHLIFMGSEQSKDYQSAMKALCFSYVDSLSIVSGRDAWRWTTKKDYTSTPSCLPKLSIETPAPSSTTTIKGG